MKSGTSTKVSAPPFDDWQEVLKERLRLYGHRNWVVIADSAYPAQSRKGIETIVANADQLAAIETVLLAIAETRHVKAVVYTDSELAFVSEADAPGISDYQVRLNRLLSGRQRRTLAHEEIIAKLDQAGETFRILIVKTNLTLPYTSVFLELDCAYWSTEAEATLRARVPQKVL